jgi:ABC-type phosphate/phosphonate transport system substrate-binding protein
LPLSRPSSSSLRARWQTFATLCLLIATLLSPTAHPAADATEGIAPTKAWFGLGSIPYLGPQETADALASIKEAMEFVLKSRVRFHSSFTADGFSRQVEMARDDFILIYPTQYQLAIDSGYLPLARLESPLRAFIVVPVASPVRSLNDLRDKLLLVPGYGSPVGELAQQAVEAVGLRWNQDVITRSLRNDGVCLLEMLRGLSDACAAFQAPNKVIQQRLGIKLRSVGQSRALPPLLFAGHRRVSTEDLDKVRKLLISLSKTDSGRFRLRKSGLGPIVDIGPEDYPSITPAAAPLAELPAELAPESKSEPTPESTPILPVDAPP